MPAGKSRSSKANAADVVAREMPEWEIVEKPAPRFASAAAFDKGATMKIDEDLSIAKLRRKFGVSDSNDKESAFKPVDTSVQTVRIKPRSGGAAKTADIKNGKVTIVQG